MVRREAGLSVVCLFSALFVLVVNSTMAVLAEENDQGSWIRGAPSPEPTANREKGDPEATAEVAAKAEIMQSDEMLKALIWLDEYFAVSAEPGEKSREELEAELAQMSSIELRRFLLKFQQERERAKELQAAFGRQREQSLARRRDYLRGQRAERKAGVDRSYYGSHRRHFGSTHHYYRGKPRFTPRRHYVVRPPLITSLEVARYTVYRSLLGRHW